MTGNQAVDSLIGRVFKGYKVTRFIARGGMGRVVEATDTLLGRTDLKSFENGAAKLRNVVVETT